MVVLVSVFLNGIIFPYCVDLKQIETEHRKNESFQWSCPENEFPDRTVWDFTWETWGLEEKYMMLTWQVGHIPTSKAFRPCASSSPWFFGNIPTTCSRGIQCFSHDVQTSSQSPWWPRNGASGWPGLGPARNFGPGFCRHWAAECSCMVYFPCTVYTWEEFLCSYSYSIDKLPSSSLWNHDGSMDHFGGKARWEWFAPTQNLVFQIPMNQWQGRIITSLSASISTSPYTFKINAFPQQYFLFYSTRSKTKTQEGTAWSMGQAYSAPL